MEAAKPKRGTLDVGSLLGDTYQIVRLIGEGGMGEVYEARHARLAGRYAVKVIRKDLVAHNPMTVQRFQREAEVTSALRHPNIVQIIDFNVTPEGSPYIVMEYLEGSDLETRINQRGPMPVHEAVVIVEQIASALAAAHGRGVVHRDLKPQNVLLVPIPVALAGQPTEFVKVLDFGISKVKTAGTLTGQPTIMGTPNYMAPEQARGQGEEIDGRADQFALAAMTYELLSGRKAFGGDTLEGILYCVVREEPASLIPVAGEAVDAVLRIALAKDRSARYPNITNFASALRQAGSRSARGGKGATGAAAGAVATKAGIGASRRDITYETAGDHAPAPAPGSGAEASGARRTGRAFALRAALIVVGVAAALTAAAIVVKRPPAGRGAPVLSSQAASLATVARAGAEQAFTAERRALEARVKTAAEIPELRNAAKSHIDSFTFNDLFDSEDWWQPYRDQTAIVFDGAHPLVSRGAPDVAAIDPWTFWRKTPASPTSALILGGQRAYLAGGVGLGPEGELGLVLAAALDADGLARLAPNAGAAWLAVSDGKRLYGLPAAPEVAAELAALLGREDEPAVLLRGGRVAAALSISPGVWLWTVVDPKP
jgi:tRNA A-37 threonylcarbamoyl transferase component Bud32